MDEGDVSYETLQEMLRLERRSNKLTPLANGFWAKLQAFLKEIEDEFREAQAKDPFAKRVMMMTDRIKNARHAAEAVWTLRERKIAMLALAHVRDPGDVQGMTKLEKALYQDILKALQDGRAAIFEGTAEATPRKREPDRHPHGSTAASPAASVRQEPDTPADEPAPAPHAAPDVDAPDTSMGDEDDEKDETDQGEAVPPAEDEAPARPPPVSVPSDTKEADTVVIRALGAIPPFVGPDMQTYLLDEGDVASVPRSIGDLLVRRGKAAIIEPDTPSVNA